MKPAPSPSSVSVELVPASATYLKICLKLRDCDEREEVDANTPRKSTTLSVNFFCMGIGQRK